MTATRQLVHPLAIALFATPALVGVLVAHKPWFAIGAIVCCLLFALLRGARFAAITLVSTVAFYALNWFGMGLWLPSDAAVSGALRIVSLTALLIVPAAFLNFRVIADTLIDRFRVPYRVMDTVLLGERFATLMRADLDTIATMAKLRSRGRPARTLAMRSRATIPVLVASFRHSDELAISMDARGFGTHPVRTVHHSRAVRASDVLALVAVWAATIAIFVLLDRM